MSQPQAKPAVGDAKTVKAVHMTRQLGESRGWVKGVLLTFVIAILADHLVQIPFLSIMGIMIVSILLGIGWRSLFDVPADAGSGIAFSSKMLLRAGIILMGLRLQLSQIVESGFSVVLVDVTVVVFTISFMMWLASLLKVEKQQSILLAVGTAICGAAAIVAIAPLIRAKQETTAVSVACIAILGTLGTILYTVLYPFLGLTPDDYGIFVGATLHELAHVIAAAVPGGDVGSEMALLVKLGRVALLIPVALVFSYLFHKREAGQSEDGDRRRLPIPWFIFGFLAMSLVQTMGILPDGVTEGFVTLSVFLLSMAMAGLGLSIKAADLKQLGGRGAAVSLLGYAGLAILGLMLLPLVSIWGN
ncbi:YeiH family protein [Brevibacillus humidisoli]|uniref:YeiH family protein n=1 Tax=Brevibacillus humidisoli TaxID=2895522 RepID=UPI001E2EAEB9|nr:YeiH family protein [Brevibacillus humidisoli]UFJ38918.1 YeiH family protein [Brevibacillus humidisoli]